jgi:hypothetical protein
LYGLNPQVQRNCASEIVKVPPTFGPDEDDALVVIFAVVVVLADELETAVDTIATTNNNDPRANQLLFNMCPSFVNSHSTHVHFHPKTC